MPTNSGTEVCKPFYINNRASAYSDILHGFKARRILRCQFVLYLTISLASTKYALKRGR